MDRHQDDVRKLASAIVDPEVKRSIILNLEVVDSLVV